MAVTEGATRRTVLGGGLTALVALVAHALGRPDMVRAADGGPMLLGSGNAATDTTGLEIISDTSIGLWVRNLQSNAVPGSGTGAAIEGYSVDGKGVIGRSSGDSGVVGISSTSNGVFGHTDALHGRAGVYGESGDRTSSGVIGVNAENRTMGLLGTETAGVLGQVPNAPGFIGVHAFALEEATALSVDGTATFSRSGKVSLPKGRSYVDVPVPGGLSPTSLVLAIPMLNRAGTYVQSAVPNETTGKVRINLNRVASSTSSTPIAWFVVN